MPLRDLLGSSPDRPYDPSDPRNPKNYYKVVHDKRKADEAEQDRRMSEAYAAGKLKHYQPGSTEGVGRQSAVEAGTRERKIPGVISHNDALYFATASGWTHAERWRPSPEDEAERLRREGHGIAVAVEAGGVDREKYVEGGGCPDGEKRRDCGGGTESSADMVEVVKGKQRKKSIGDKVKSFMFGAAGVTKE
jgi:hypothetical protein